MYLLTPLTSIYHWNQCTRCHLRRRKNINKKKYINADSDEKLRISLRSGHRWEMTLQVVPRSEEIPSNWVLEVNKLFGQNITWKNKKKSRISEAEHIFQYPVWCPLVRTSACGVLRMVHYTYYVYMKSVGACGAHVRLNLFSYYWEIIIFFWISQHATCNFSSISI